MSTQSSLDIKTDVTSYDKVYDPLTRLKKDSRSGESSRIYNKISSNGSPRMAKTSYLLGEAVHHRRFGKGRVLAHWPDGTLLIRFNNSTKNRLVWPSFLDRSNRQQR